MIMILDYIQTNHEYSFHTVLVKSFHVSGGLSIASSTLSHCIMFQVLDIGFQWVFYTFNWIVSVTCSLRLNKKICIIFQ